MTRFEFKLKVNFIDEETGEEIYHKVLIDNSNGNEIGFDDMVGLLNKLHQENQKLKHYKLYEDNKRLQTIIADLKKENEQLRKENNFLKQIREAFQIDVKNSRQMLKRWDKYE